MLAAAGSTRMPVSRLPHRITSADGSLKVRRRGRSVARDRGRRSAVWELIEAHLDHNRIDGTVGFATAPAVTATCPMPIAGHRFASSPHPTSAPLSVNRTRRVFIHVRQWIPSLPPDSSPEPGSIKRKGRQQASLVRFLSAIETILPTA